MRSRIFSAAVVATILFLPTASSGITFGDWASGQGYNPGAVMPSIVVAGSYSIDSLSGLGDYNWNGTPAQDLWLYDNHISSIEPGDFVGLTKLTLLGLDGNLLTSIEPDDFRGLASLEVLNLWGNQIANIEPGAFSELTNLAVLVLDYNQLTSIEASDFSGLTGLTELWLGGNPLATIEAGDFSYLTNLKWLALDDTQLSSIEASDFSGLMNLETLQLYGNQLSSIEADDFSQLSNLRNLWLDDNQLTTIERGAFSGLTNLEWLFLGNNPTLTELNLAEADFSSLTDFDVAGNVNLTRVSLGSAVLNQTSLAASMDGGVNPYVDRTGIGELGGIRELDLNGIDFANITDLAPLYVMDDLTDLWLVDTANLAASDLDAMLDELDTIEGTAIEGILHMTQANYVAFNAAGGDLLAAWDAEPGHYVAFVLPGDFDGDGDVDGADFLAWQRNPSIGSLGDWQANYGTPIPLSEGSAAIPEPGTFVLLVLAAILLAAWLKRAACRIQATR